MATYTLSELASLLGAELVGDGNATVTGLATLQNAREGDLSFLANPSYAKFLDDSMATVVILSPSQKTAAVNNALILDNPYHGYAKVTHLFDPNNHPVQGVATSASIAKDVQLGESVYIGEQAVIEEGAIIGDGAYIGAGSYVGKGSCIGAGTKLYSNVSIYHQVKLGERCIIHSGVVIGSDGFGFAPHSAGWEKIAQLGGVVLGNDVEVGANTCIDRGALDDTFIGNGVKLDNQLQIGHNVIIGDNSVLAAATVIAGSTTVGKQCVFGGACAISGHLTIADGVQLTGMSMITKSLTEPGVYSSGMPVQSNKAWHKSIAHFRRLDNLVKRVKVLEKNVKS